MENECYVSVDIETDGPRPGKNSMLSLGMAAFFAGNDTPIATFETNLRVLPGALGDASTMAWWATQPEAWRAHRMNPRDPAIAIPEAVKWIEALPGEPVFVGYPATFDFAYTHWYFLEFAGKDPFGYDGVDVRSMAMALLGSDWQGASQSNHPPQWHAPADLPHTHRALDDAIEQGVIFLRILATAQAARVMRPPNRLLKP